VARKSSNTSKIDKGSKDAFVSVVRSAFEHVTDVDWLGGESPLATPYVLGSLLIGQPLADTPVGRGLIVQRLLGEAVDACDKPLQEVLTLYYFDPAIQKDGRKRAQLVGGVIHCSEAEVYRRLHSALNAAAAFIGHQLLPTVRPETPIARAIFGRTQPLNSAMAALQVRESVVLLGPSGIGKTATGLQIAERFGRERTLWFTFRPGLNDTLANLIYAIGHFLRSLGAQAVWRQLIADRQMLVKEALISGLIRHELANIHTPVMLCLDEVGCLNPELIEHNRIIRFLEGLRDDVLMLLMGNQVFVDLGVKQRHLVLSGIESEPAEELLASEETHGLSLDDKQTLLALTHGNPALLRMFALVHGAGEPVTESLKRIADDPSAEAMLYRVFEHLSAVEQRVLSELAVYRESAPSDVFSRDEDRAALDALGRHGLILTDLVGGLEVASFVRSFVLRRMSSELWSALHRQAGEVMEARGSFTSAALYFAEAGAVSRAIRLWAGHWEVELSRGNSAIALELFISIARDRHRLSEDDQRILALLLADLSIARGDPSKAVDQLGNISWPDEHPLSPRAFKLRGTARENQNNLAAALEQYSKAIDLLTRPIAAQRVYLYRNRGYVSGIRLGDLDSARKDANQARLDAENFLGNVEEASGNFVPARQHYENALLISRSAEVSEILAHDCHTNLSRIAWRQDYLVEAIEHVQLALGISQRLGWLTAELIDKINLSAIHLVGSQPQQALAVVETALDDSLSIGNNYIIAGLCSNAAEACFFMGRLTEAERYANRVIATKEPDHTPNALLVLGRVYRAQMLVSKAVTALQDSAKSAQDGGDVYTCGAAWCELGDFYFDADDYEKAKACWSRSLEAFQKVGNERQRLALESRLSRLPPSTT
jgi:tetratricopeptide (TPR) repeat protein